MVVGRSDQLAGVVGKSLHGEVCRRPFDHCHRMCPIGQGTEMQSICQCTGYYVINHSPKPIVRIPTQVGKALWDISRKQTTYTVLYKVPCFACTKFDFIRVFF